MQNLATILSLTGTAVGLLATAITFLVRFIRTAKGRNKANGFIKICDALPPFIQQAESFTNYTGQEKKQFVLTKANQFAIQNNITFDTTPVSDKIEELVRLTREVNKGNADRGLASDRASQSMQAEPIERVSEKIIIGCRF